MQTCGSGFCSGGTSTLGCHEESFAGAAFLVNLMVMPSCGACRRAGPVCSPRRQRISQQLPALACSDRCGRQAPSRGREGAHIADASPLVMLHDVGKTPSSLKPRSYAHRA